MGSFRTNSSWVGLFLFASVGCFALLIQMPCSEAVLQCAANERYVSKVFKGIWQLTQCDLSCPNEIQTQCQNDNNRVVSKMRCNWWDPRTGDTRDEYATCEGCCGESLPTPPPPVTKECQAGEVSKTFTLPASRPWNCGLCEDKCKAECGSTEELREMCVLNYVGEPGDNTYTCRCCCKAPPPPPPPSCQCCQTNVDIQISIKSACAAPSSSPPLPSPPPPPSSPPSPPPPSPPPPPPSPPPPSPPPPPPSPPPPSPPPPPPSPPPPSPPPPSPPPPPPPRPVGDLCEPTENSFSRFETSCATCTQADCISKCAAIGETSSFDFCDTSNFLCSCCCTKSSLSSSTWTRASSLFRAAKRIKSQ